ncbi:hypothetical protein B0H10DRAFT_2391894 [Mycena sp. CBHHK59/15]|nr:hypothetical protein B0H10DRAFT_2391894 [Mycena sp. CBHHK59/15]
MGRRKIEIQPITHERNRSVTFLKACRKNGLFKKAYELGVLCSVDVAVIIFEERPGHHHKLYQYCSADIHDIVARHVQYDGERDSRGPADFSGVVKTEDAGEADDDDQEEEEVAPPPPRAPVKRTKPKMSPDIDVSRILCAYIHSPSCIHFHCAHIHLSPHASLFLVVLHLFPPSSIPWRIYPSFCAFTTLPSAYVHLHPFLRIHPSALLVSMHMATYSRRPHGYVHPCRADIDLPRAYIHLISL